jgi:hypothetical protein
MLLVFGVRQLAAVLATGLFHCPGCGGDRHYRRRRPRTWFQVFWIPLVPLRTGAEYVECRACGGRFGTGVLDVPTSALLEELLERGTRTAAAYVVTGLLARPAAAQRGGDDLPRALAVLQHALGPGYTREVFEADLDAHRQGSDLDVLASLAAQLTVLGREGLLRALADLVLALERPGEPDWRRVGDVAAALGITPTHLRGIVQAASARARE